MSVTVELVFEKTTKRTVRFHNEGYGTVYVPNDRFEQLGRPEAIRMTLEPLGGLEELAQAA